jgi:isoaspartyl peptidase/L-asparaginase-like protein (Ntn-hydrolase superfamily)
MLLIANFQGRSGVPKAVEMLRAGGDGLRAVVEGIKIVEADNDVHYVGRSSLPNILGELELDAAVMDGDTLRTGAVGALRGYLHPVEVAYEVMQRLDHEILAGRGAERFAEEIGAEKTRNETEYSLRTWKEHLDGVLTEEQQKRFPDIRLLDIRPAAGGPERKLGTTVFLSIDRGGKISASTSTSGWPWKYPGRLGDSPIVGAGLYADSRCGACACTGAGEMTIRAGTARIVVHLLKRGYPVGEAVREAAEELAGLRTGFLDGVWIHAVDAGGKCAVLGVGVSAPGKYWYWNDSLPSAQDRDGEVFAGD